MRSTIRGSLLPFLQAETWDFDPARGYAHRLDYKGASQAQMLALQQDYVRAGIACRLAYHQGDTSSLSVEDSTQQFTLDSWQMMANEESRDGLGHPSLTSALANGGYDVEVILQKTREHLANNESPQTLFAAGGDFFGAPAILQRFYRLQFRGATEYRRVQYVLRHTTNAPNRWSRNISDIGKDCIYTEAQLLTEVQSASLWIYPLPYRLAYKIAAIPAPTAQANYLWGWLKDGSTETTAANNRIEITTEYVLEQWSTDYYAPL